MAAFGAVWVEYHTLLLIADVTSYWDEIVALPSNGLAEVQGHTLRINTGISLGHVGVAVNITEQAPPVSESWEESVEVELPVNRGEVRVAVLDADVPPQLEQFPAPNGTYIVRVSARGRDIEPDGTGPADPGAELFERYLLELWPAG